MNIYNNIKIYIYNPHNSIGLRKDSLLFNKYIRNSKIIKNSSEITFFPYILLLLENTDIIEENYLQLSLYNILMVNYDLFNTNDLRKKYIDCYLCKNIATHEIMKVLIENMIINSARIIYTNFSTLPNNLYDKNIEKNYKLFLHIAGRSSYKNTNLILNTWNNYKLPPLIIICFDRCFERLLIKDVEYLKNKNITLINEKISEEEINKIKNKVGFHLCPSMREGYGHYINECRMVKSVCITIDIAPYNELIDEESGFLIKSDKVIVNKDMSFQVSASFKEEELARKIGEIMSVDVKRLVEMGENAYNKYLSDEKYFGEIMGKIREIINHTLE